MLLHNRTTFVYDCVINTKNTLMSSQTKSAYLTVRVPINTRTKFHVKSRKFGTPSEILRELVDAFIEDRIAIQPPVIRNLKENLYVTRSQN